MAYLIDSDVFIQAKNLHYGFDFCPVFWDWVLRENAGGSVFSIDKVQGELQTGNDNLAQWVTGTGSGIFLPVDASTVAAMRSVSVWIQSQGYKQASINSFQGGADPWLISYAMANGYTVVTQEQLRPDTKKVKIPNVCAGLGVQYMTPFQMLRAEKARFNL